MSYEGYEVWLCENGHKSNFDCYDSPIQMYGDDDIPTRRCWCGAKLIWWEPVDETNPADECENGVYPGSDIISSLQIKTPAVYSVCEHCHHWVLVQQETYEIPEKGIGHHLV